jgi:hypothetical protein
MQAPWKTLGLLAFLTLVAVTAFAAPLGTAFTYQGHLSQSGVPVDGPVTLRFSLWDAAGSGDPPTGGAQIGASQILLDVPVAGGLFSVEVNGGGEFGAAAFNGEARWLQVEVCTDGTCSATTVLGPRQALTGAPYALGPWQLSGTSIGFSGGNVGIGTTAPTARLDVRGGALAVENLGNQADLLWLNTDRNWVFRQEGAGSSAALKLESVGGGGNKNFIVQTTGLMGVGTTAPTAKLDVRGDIRLGFSGEYYAPAGETNLRIIRGIVANTGFRSFGAGFTSTRISTGVYDVSFSTTFVDRPTVTVSAESSGTVRIALVDSPTIGGVRIRIVNAAGTPADGYFHIMVMGLR